HFWAQVCGTAGWHRWVHCWAQEGALLGTGGCTARHRWAHCWAQVGITGGWHCWAPIIRALMIGADPCSDNCRFSAAAVIGLLPHHVISCVHRTQRSR
ncbi:unnamed protein product, partial [Staurois parvus]